MRVPYPHRTFDQVDESLKYLQPYLPLDGGRPVSLADLRRATDFVVAGAEPKGRLAVPT
jgi:hypothetical protein